MIARRIAGPRRQLPHASALLLVFPLLVLAPSAGAQSVLERVKARGAVSCGAVARPGLAQTDAQGRWSGVFVDICAALASAVLGSPEHLHFHAYATDADFASRVGNGVDDLHFLTGREIATHALAGSIVPGPAAFAAHIQVMVPQAAPEQHLPELAGKGICFLVADPAERSLEAYFDERKLPWQRHAYSEPGEMLDAFAAQRCHGIAGEATWLASALGAGTRPGPHARLLPEALESFPIVAATPVQDGRWAAIVAWTLGTLITAQIPSSRWTPGGVDAMPIAGAQLGLAPDWQQAALQARGHYGTIFRRNLAPLLGAGDWSGEMLAPDGLPAMPFVE